VPHHQLLKMCIKMHVFRCPPTPTPESLTHSKSTVTLSWQLETHGVWYTVIWRMTSSSPSFMSDRTTSSPLHTSPWGFWIQNFYGIDLLPKLFWNAFCISINDPIFHCVWIRDIHSSVVQLSEWLLLPVLLNKEHTLLDIVHHSITRMKHRLDSALHWWNVPRPGGTAHYNPRENGMQSYKDWVRYISTTSDKQCVNIGFLAESLGPVATDYPAHFWVCDHSSVISLCLWWWR
jgi:hypothetical protein